MGLRDSWFGPNHLNRQRAILSGNLDPDSPEDLALLALTVLDGLYIVSTPPGHCCSCAQPLHSWPEAPQWVDENGRFLCNACKHEAQLHLLSPHYFRKEHDLEVLARCWDEESFKQEASPGPLRRAWQRAKRAVAFILAKEGPEPKRHQ